MVDAVERRQDDDGARGLGLAAHGQECKPIAVGQASIEEDEIEGGTRKCLFGVTERFYRIGHEPLPDQMVAQHSGDLWLVFND